MHAGTYQVQFIIPGFVNPPTATIMVHVVQCPLSDVTSVTGDMCQTGERGYYSFDPRNSTCDICVPNAECSGGALIQPTPGFWHSAPHSIQMHRWVTSWLRTHLHKAIQALDDVMPLAAAHNWFHVHFWGPPLLLKCVQEVPNDRSSMQCSNEIVTATTPYIGA